LDLEGVLIPEVWQAVADRTGIAELQQTTRDIPVYEDLMGMRLQVLAQHDIRMSTIAEVIDGLEPLPGALDFVRWLQPRFQLAIISDTFYEFGLPFMAKLDWPTLLCHRLVVEDDHMVGYQLRQPDPKRASVKAFHDLRYRVFAAGDSYNDTAMLEEADQGFLFCAPDKVKAEFPQYAQAESYATLQQLLQEAAG
jgi:phosphoserine/homoserine phosphotransferase